MFPYEENWTACTGVYDKSYSGGFYNGEMI